MKEKKLPIYDQQARVVASQSPDAQTKVGALLIHKETGAILGSGYNGFIKGAKDSKIPNTRPNKYEYIIHAEANLICNCVRHSVSTENCAVFCTLSPCVHCMRLLYQSGITDIYFAEMYKDFQKSQQMKDMEITPILLENNFYYVRLRPKAHL